MFRPLAIQAGLDMTAMNRVAYCLHELGTSAIELNDARERLQTLLGPDLTDAAIVAMNAAVDMMSSCRGMDESANILFRAIVAAVPHFCRPNVADEDAQEEGEDGAAGGDQERRI